MKSRKQLTLAFLIAIVLLVVIVKTGRDFYGILGIKRNASPSEIKKAFRKLSL